MAITKSVSFAGNITATITNGAITNMVFAIDVTLLDNGQPTTMVYTMPVSMWDALLPAEQADFNAILQKLMAVAANSDPPLPSNPKRVIPMLPTPPPPK